LGARLGLGTMTDLDTARAAVDFPVLVPTAEGLGAPDAVYLTAVPRPGMVSLVYGAREGIPVSRQGVALLVTQFAASIEPGTFTKVVDSGASVAATRVGASDAWWISGGEHFFVYTSAGQLEVERSRLVGDTLVWQAGDVVYRLEARVPMDEAVKLAESIR
jgi:hypothetical protein